jgi:tetratricopeptide (TPR) repeat protein
MTKHSTRRSPDRANTARAELSTDKPALADRLAALGPAVALVLWVAVSYAPLVRAGFIWDDDFYVTENTALRTLDGLRRIWCELGAVPQYYPLVHTTFWIEYHLWGLSPVGYHLINVLLHATSAILLWRLLLRWQVPGSWLAAAIFAVHPVMVESVAWVTERKNVLSLALALGSLLCYTRFAPLGEAAENRDQGRWRWYAAAFLLYAGALFSKTVVATLPAVLLVVCWWKRGRISVRDVVPLLPWFALGATLGTVTALMERYHVGAEGELWNFSLLDRSLIAGRALWFYAAKLVWPHPLVFFYPRWPIDDGDVRQYVYPLAAVAVLSALWLARGRIGRGPVAAALIFTGALAPALGFFNVYPMRFSFVADHFQYHASLALIALFAAFGTRIATSLPPSLRKFAGTCALALLAALALATFQRTRIFFDPEALYADTIAYNPDCCVAYTNLGAYLDSVGRSDEALSLARDTLSRFPDDPAAHTNLGAALLRLGNRDGFKPGQLDEIVGHFHVAIEHLPQHPGPHNNLGFALMAAGRYDEAAEHFSHNLQIDQQNADSLYGLGWCSAQQNKPVESLAYYTRALAINPRLGAAHYGLATLLLGQQRIDEAIDHLETALRLSPEIIDAHFLLANVLANRHDYRRAAEHYQMVLRARPTYDRALNNLGAVLMNLGEADRAIACFEESIRQNPEYAEARKNLSDALHQRQEQQPAR